MRTSYTHGINKGLYSKFQESEKRHLKKAHGYNGWNAANMKIMFVGIAKHIRERAFWTPSIYVFFLIIILILKPAFEEQLTQKRKKDQSQWKSHDSSLLMS